MVGQGAFGKVMLSRIKATGEVVAVKIVNKELIQKLGKTRSIFRERDLLNELQHPFIIKLIAVTMDDENLYFVFENCETGDLADLIQTRKSFSLEVTRIYAAQMVQCLDYLQKKEVMHRDLKP